jgi:multidrug efflux pump
MESLNISFNDVAGAISNENISISGGNLLIDGYRRNIRVVGDFKRMEDIENVIVKHEGGDLVYLRDIADVDFTEVEKESYAREFGRPVVMLDVMKRAGENLIIVSDKISDILTEAKTSYFPKNLEISVTNDQSDQTKNQLNELENSIIFGMLLVVLVLMFFLGLRNALFVGIAIPLSMLMSFLILSTLGVTLNTIVLFSLVLALGMLVDNGIVIVENIYRLMDEGMERQKAAKYGAGEVALAIIASTATTLAAFVPLAFWPGIFGEFMSYLPLTLIIVLASSLFVALVINPGLTSRLMKVQEEEPDKKKWTRIAIFLVVIGLLIGYVLNALLPVNILWLGNLFLISGVLILSHIWIVTPLSKIFRKNYSPKLKKSTKRTLAFALRGRNPYVFFGGTVALFFLSIALLVGNQSTQNPFLPINQPNMAMVYIELPIGTDIEETNKVTLELEEKVSQLADKYTYEHEVNGRMEKYNYMVESIIAQVGEGTSDPNQGPSMAQTPNKSKITVAFREFSERVDGNGNLLMSADVLEEIRAEIGSYPGVQIVVDKDEQGPPAGAPINIEVEGDDYIFLVKLAQRH